MEASRAKAIILASLFFLPWHGAAQDLPRTGRLAVKDSSEAGAPLRATGSATVSSKITPEGIESTSELTASLENVSSKPIMAFEAVVDLSPHYGGGERVTSGEDYFFSNHPLMPGSTYLIRVSPQRELVYESHRTPPPTPDSSDHRSLARAEVKITFVQFSDGTTFGACEWARGLPAQREKLIEIINGLLRAYDRDKGTGLSSAIERAQAKTEISSDLYSTLSHIRQKFRDGGATAAVEQLKKYLANAERNSVGGTPKADGPAPTS